MSIIGGEFNIIVSGLPLFDVSYSIAQAFLKAQGN